MSTRSTSEVVYTHLELTSSDDFKPKEISDSQFRVVEMTIKQWQFNKFLYELVGKKWHWYDKIEWADSDWMTYIGDRKLTTSVGYHKGSVAGYYELIKQDKEVQIAYFGLAPDYIGKGLGGALLSAAIKQAFKLGAERIWLSTCSLDHPHAINNYKSRGMSVFTPEEKACTDR